MKCREEQHIMEIYKNDFIIALDKQEIHLFDMCMFYVITKVASFTLSTRQIQ